MAEQEKRAESTRSKVAGRRRDAAVAVLLSIALLSAACGSDADEVTTDTTVSPAASQESAEDTSDQAADSSDPRWITDVLTADRTELGWTVPAGRWVSNAFDPPVAFETDRELVLVSEEDQVVYLALPDENNLIMVAGTAGLWNGRAEVPVPEEAEAMTDALAANPANTIVEQGTLGGGHPWWEIVIEEQPLFTYPCHFGLDCVFSTFAADNQLHAIQGERTRLLARNDVALGLAVHVTGESAGIDEAIEAGEAIAASLTVSDTVTGEGGLSFVGRTKGNGPLDGAKLARIGEYTVRVDDPSVLEEFDIFSNLGLLSVKSPNGVFEVVDPIWIDGANTPDRFTLPPTAHPAYLPGGPTTTVEVDAYLREFVVVEAEGTVEIGGRSAAWWDVGGVVDERTVDCEVPGYSGPCAVLYAAESYGAITMESDPTRERIFWFEPTGPIALVSAHDGALEERLEQLDPLLRALTID